MQGNIISNHTKVNFIQQASFQKAQLLSNRLPVPSEALRALDKKHFKNLLFGGYDKVQFKTLDAFRVWCKKQKEDPYKQHCELLLPLLASLKSHIADKK